MFSCLSALGSSSFDPSQLYSGNVPSHNALKDQLRIRNPFLRDIAVFNVDDMDHIKNTLSFEGAVDRMLLHCQKSPLRPQLFPIPCGWAANVFTSSQTSLQATHICFRGAPDIFTAPPPHTHTHLYRHPKHLYSSQLFDSLLMGRWG